eukprot:TRINITY_DN3317_c0_g3_i1.p1 TRINITY_DN3317_c0_g3~~TRINITY_DN3317_c0_g3_i1.p1  ORF type:complete len:282 (-),score=105.60 TRINITY_DN3317_c0_g3_i1:22-867(-)
MLDDKQQQIRNLESELLRLKDLAGRRTDEIGLVSREISIAAASAGELVKRKKEMEQELAVEVSRRRDAQLEGERLSDSNNQLSVQNRNTEDVIKENELEIRRLNERLDIANREMADTNAAVRGNEGSIAVTVDEKQKLQREIESTMVANRRLGDENKELEMRARDLNVQIDQVMAKYKDNLLLIDGKERDLQVLKSNLARSEDRGAEVRGQAIKTLQDNKVLQSLLDKYRDDVEAERRLREQEVARKLAVEEEKKRLELSLIHICRCRRYAVCRSRWSPYH